MTTTSTDCLLAINRHFDQVLSASKYINKTETQLFKTPKVYNKFCNIHKLYKLCYVCNVFLLAISHVRVLAKTKMLADNIKIYAVV